MHAEMSEKGLQDSPDRDTAAQARPETQQQSTSGMVHRLPMDHELFAEGNLRRGLLAQQAAVSQEDKKSAQSADSSSGPRWVFACIHPSAFVKVTLGMRMQGR